MKELTLDYPLIIDGFEVRDISYDFSDFTMDDYLAALNDQKTPPEKVINPANNGSLHLALGIRCILASNKGKGWTAEDFSRLRGNDLWKVTAAGLNFFIGKSEEQADDKPEEQSGPIASDSTQQEAMY